MQFLSNKVKERIRKKGKRTSKYLTSNFNKLKIKRDNSGISFHYRMKEKRIKTLRTARLPREI